jgi:hypothetical protein
MRRRSPYFFAFLLVIAMAATGCSKFSSLFDDTPTASVPANTPTAAEDKTALTLIFGKTFKPATPQMPSSSILSGGPAVATDSAVINGLTYTGTRYTQLGPTGNVIAQGRYLTYVSYSDPSIGETITDIFAQDSAISWDTTMSGVAKTTVNTSVDFVSLSMSGSMTFNYHNGNQLPYATLQSSNVTMEFSVKNFSNPIAASMYVSVQIPFSLAVIANQITYTYTGTFSTAQNVTGSLPGLSFSAPIYKPNVAQAIGRLDVDSTSQTMKVYIYNDQGQLQLLM